MLFTHINNFQVPTDKELFKFATLSTINIIQFSVKSLNKKHEIRNSGIQS